MGRSCYWILSLLSRRIPSVNVEQSVLSFLVRGVLKDGSPSCESETVLCLVSWLTSIGSSYSADSMSLRLPFISDMVLLYDHRPELLCQLFFALKSASQHAAMTEGTIGAPSAANIYSTIDGLRAGVSSLLYVYTEALIVLVTVTGLSTSQNALAPGSDTSSCPAASRLLLSSLQEQVDTDENLCLLRDVALELLMLCEDTTSSEAIEYGDDPDQIDIDENNDQLSITPTTTSPLVSRVPALQLQRGPTSHCNCDGSDLLTIADRTKPASEVMICCCFNDDNDEEELKCEEEDDDEEEVEEKEGEVEAADKLSNTGMNVWRDVSPPCSIASTSLLLLAGVVVVAAAVCRCEEGVMMSLDLQHLHALQQNNTSHSTSHTSDADSASPQQWKAFVPRRQVALRAQIIRRVFTSRGMQCPSEFMSTISQVLSCDGSNDISSESSKNNSSNIASTNSANGTSAGATLLRLLPSRSLGLLRQSSLLDAVSRAVTEVHTHIHEPHDARDRRLRDALKAGLEKGLAPNKVGLEKGLACSCGICMGSNCSSRKSVSVGSDAGTVSAGRDHCCPGEGPLPVAISTMWPMLSPLHSEQVLFESMDIEQCEVLKSSKYPVLLVFKGHAIKTDSKDDEGSVGFPRAAPLKGQELQQDREGEEDNELLLETAPAPPAAAAAAAAGVIPSSPSSSSIDVDVDSVRASGAVARVRLLSSNTMMTSPSRQSMSSFTSSDQLQTPLITDTANNQSQRQRRSSSATSLSSKNCQEGEPLLKPSDDATADVTATTTVEVTTALSLAGATNSRLLLLESDLDPDAVSSVPETRDESSASHTSDRNGAAAIHQPPSSYIVLFKRGDDLRQDELVIELLQFMDSTLKMNGLDLCIVTYSVMSTGYREGIIEWIDGAVPISVITEELRKESVTSPISEFLRRGGLIRATDQSKPTSPECKHRNSPSLSIDGISEAVLDTYMKSCAGYSVISYILGFGDRHLDNLLLKPTGEFFHVDFGYCFGKDPKPSMFRPLLRITRDMVAALGGPGSLRYNRFLQLCCETYNILRGRAGDIISLIEYLWCHTEVIEGGGGGGRHSTHTSSSSSSAVTLTEATAVVRERLQLHLDNDAASDHLQKVIEDSIGAFMPYIMEQVHKLARVFR